MEIGFLRLLHGRELKEKEANLLFKEDDATSNMGSTRGRDPGAWSGRESVGQR
jgi:hypothetical protein